MGYVVRVFTDGASTGKIGPGGWAYVMLIADRRWIKGAGPAKRTTNQRMEMIAVIMALREAPPNSHVTVYSDSAYVINGMNSGWWIKWHENGWRNARGEPVKNQKLWLALLDAEKLHERVDYIHIRGHVENGTEDHKLNGLADEMAVRAKELAMKQEKEAKDD